jgi:hypothetical protein
MRLSGDADQLLTLSGRRHTSGQDRGLSAVSIKDHREHGENNGNRHQRDHGRRDVDEEGWQRRQR